MPSSIDVVGCVFAALLTACSGEIGAPSGAFGSRSGDPGAQPGGSGTPGGGTPGSGTPGTTGIPGTPSGGFDLVAGVGARSRLWRLTEGQYRNAVKDLLNVTVTTEIPADDAGGLFGNRADLLDVSQALLEAYANVAEEAANQMVPARLGELLKCQPVNAASAACVEPFLRAFGARAWRRPLGDDEVASLLKLHSDMTNQFDGNAGVSAVLQAFLTSPKFLFRSEVGDVVAGSNTRRLTAFEVASAMSFGFWNTAPDGALTDAATSGKLSMPSDIQAIARTMLNDPRAKETTTDFVEKWLGIDGVATTVKSAMLFPAYSPALMQSMESDARLFAGSTLWDGAGGLRDLLTSSCSFVNPKTAPIYGVTATAAMPERVTLNPAERLGILTQTAFLAAHASEDATKPVLRGKFVRENLLCQEVPAPPPNVKVDIPTTGTNQTARQRFTMHASDPSCSACHKMFDGLGFAFENYDALGRYRTLDNGMPIDATGTLLDAATGVETPFKNAIDLIKTLAASEQTYRCFTQRLFESFGGREPVQSDVSDLVRAYAAFHDAGYDVKSLLSALVAADGFLIRQAD